MADYQFVTSRVATGAAIESNADVEQLVKDGITHVINCRAEQNDGPLFVGYPSIIYLWNPTDDPSPPKPSKPPDWFDRSLRFGLSALANPRMRVLAHCQGGSNRGPSTTYAILRACGFAPAAAEAAIRGVRPQVELAYKTDADAAVIALGYV